MSRPDATPAQVELNQGATPAAGLSSPIPRVFGETCCSIIHPPIRRVVCLLSTLLLIAAILLLTGCETVKPLTTRIETVQIKVPIAIPCIAKADVPVVPNLAAPTNGTPDQMAAWVSALVLLLDRYTDEADAIIRGCAGK